MAKVKLVEKKVQMDLIDIIRFQLITHFFITRISVSNSELMCLSLLGSCGESELGEFCDLTVTQGIFKTSQTARNVLTKAEKMGVITKIGKGRKKVMLNPELKIQSEGNILLNLKAFYLNGS